MSEIIYRDLSENGPVEECRELCNCLMKFQAEKAVLYKDILSSMNFDNRLKPGFDSAEKRFLYVAYDGDKPIGYIFCDAGTVTEEVKIASPPWAKSIPKESGELYPYELPVPVIASHLNNLYIMPEYREQKVGKALMEKAMAWLSGIPGVEYVFVHVSNGNNAADFYEKYGFKYSHSVYDGMISALVINLGEKQPVYL